MRNKELSGQGGFGTHLGAKRTTIGRSLPRTYSCLLLAQALDNPEAKEDWPSLKEAESINIGESILRVRILKHFLGRRDGDYLRLLSRVRAS